MESTGELRGVRDHPGMVGLMPAYLAGSWERVTLGGVRLGQTHRLEVDPDDVTIHDVQRGNLHTAPR